MAIAHLFLSTICILPICCSAFQSSQWIDAVGRRQSGRKSSSLAVSELHVPGYAQTKLPFILKVEHLKEKSPEGATTIIQPVEKTFKDDDFQAMVPHNGGHLIHKTKSPIFTKEECERIVNEAEDVASKIEWSKNRHGNVSDKILRRQFQNYVL